MNIYQNILIKNLIELKHFQYVTDGDIIDLGNERKILIIFTPDHTPDSISLLDIQERILFVEDIVYLEDIYLYRPETNLEDYVKSLEKLICMLKIHEIQLIIPSHYIPTVNPDYLIQALDAIKKIQENKIIPKKTY